MSQKQAKLRRYWERRAAHVAWLSRRPPWWKFWAVRKWRGGGAEVSEHTPVVFMDGICPKCGEICGNGGVGDVLRCRCGWSGRMDESDTKLIEDFIRRAQERNREEAPR